MFYLIWLYAGLCLFLSNRQKIWKDGMGWSIGWLVIFLIFWPFYPILVYLKLD